MPYFFSVRLLLLFRFREALDHLLTTMKQLILSVISDVTNVPLLSLLLFIPVHLHHRTLLYPLLLGEDSSPITCIVLIFKILKFIIMFLNVCLFPISFFCYIHFCKILTVFISVDFRYGRLLSSGILACVRSLSGAAS